MLNTDVFMYQSVLSVNAVGACAARVFVVVVREHVALIWYT